MGTQRKLSGWTEVILISNKGWSALQCMSNKYSKITLALNINYKLPWACTIVLSVPVNEKVKSNIKL